MKIDGQLQLDVNINGTVFNAMSIPGLMCQISSGVTIPIPECKIHLIDYAGQIDTNSPINDGTPFSILLSDTSNTGTSTQFRAFGTPKRAPLDTNPSVSVYTLLGKLDCIPFISAHPNAAFTGTSDAVMQQIASKNGLTYKGSVTGNDNMTWLPGRKTWQKYADHVADHAYVDDNSSLSWAVDEAKNLHYVNIPKLFNSNSYKAYIYKGNPDQTQSTGSTVNAKNKMFSCVDYKAYNRSGVLNTVAAYGMRTSQPSLAGATPNKYLAANATVFGNRLDVSSNLSQLISNVSRMHLPPADTGSAHAKYIHAKHQNRRITCTYAQNVYVLMYQQTGLSIYDSVKFTANTASGSTNSLVNGNYVITAISRYVYSNRYIEKLELTSNGPDDSNSSLLT